jgi:hypothetical protein
MRNTPRWPTLRVSSEAAGSGDSTLAKGLKAGAFILVDEGDAVSVDAHAHVDGRLGVASVAIRHGVDEELLDDQLQAHDQPRRHPGDGGLDEVRDVRGLVEARSELCLRLQRGCGVRGWA